MITAELRRAIGAAAGHPGADPQLRPGPQPGSYSSSLPFRLARDPRRYAQALAARLAAEPWIDKADVTGPGYLTVTVTRDALAGLAVRIAQGRPGLRGQRRAARPHRARARRRPDRRAGLAVRPGGPRRRGDRPSRRHRGCHGYF